jgi:hypothetical protein
VEWEPAKKTVNAYAHLDLKEMTAHGELAQIDAQTMEYVMFQLESAVVIWDGLVQIAV